MALDLKYEILQNNAEYLLGIFVSMKYTLTEGRESLQSK